MKTELRQRRPRIKNERHLKFIRALPCLICGRAPPSEAAHIRLSDASYDVFNPGTGRKSDDSQTLPLCGRHHREQHGLGERDFWKRRGIDPVPVALALHRISGDTDAALFVLIRLTPNEARS